MTTKRIYLVTDNFSDDGTRYLIRANSAAQAVRHCSQAQYKAKVADQEELLAAFNDRIVVEDAGVEQTDETDTAGT